MVRVDQHIYRGEIPAIGQTVPAVVLNEETIAKKHREGDSLWCVCVCEMRVFVGRLVRAQVS